MFLENYKKLSEILEALHTVVVPVVIIAAWFVADKILKRFIRRVAKTIRAKLAADDSTNAWHKTMESLAVPFFRVALGIVFLMTLLNSLGIDVRPVLAGVGVVGLGISLAAKNILQDFLNGLLIVMENQYNVGDWINLGSVSGLGGISGTVEGITFRVTRLRTIDGDLVIVPNSAIVAVMNQTKGHSTARVEVGVTYDTDIKQAIKVMEDAISVLIEAMPEYEIQTPSVQGVVSFESSSVVLRALIKCPAGAQWLIGRTYRLILMDKFKEENINFAFNHIDVNIVNK